VTAPLFYEDSLGERLAQAIKNLPNADDELIDNPGALDEAQREVNAEDPEAVYARVAPDWVPVFGPSKLSGLIDVAGPVASVVVMPLAAAGISFAWDPYPPEEMPGAAYPNDHVVDRPFTLLVAPEDADEARALICATTGSWLTSGTAATWDRERGAVRIRKTFAWSLFIVWIGPGLGALLYSIAYPVYHLLRYHRF